MFKLFGQETSVRGASLLLIVTLALSNVLGLFRDFFLTRNISYAESDVYFAAFRIPDTVFNFLILGAITSAFIPIFADFVAKKKLDDGYQMASSMINIASSAMLVVAVVFFFLMPILVPLIVPNFSLEKIAETVKLSRLLMMTPIFFSASYVIGGILNTSRRFLAYSLAPLLYNASIIFGALWAAPRFGVVGVVYCVVAGAALHALIQIPALFHLGFKYSVVANFRDKNIRKILRLMVPRSISLGASQMLLTVFTAVASTLAVGAISAFNYSNNIQTVPVVVLGNSFAAAVFPTLAIKISENDNKGFATYLLRAMKSIAFLLIPSSIILVLLRAQIVRLILGSDKIGWDDTKMTALTLGFFSISLLAQGLIPLFARAFFALKNTKIPMYASLAMVISSVILAYPLTKYFSVSGLALAFSVGSFIHLGILFAALQRRYPDLNLVSLVSSLEKIVINSLIMGVGVWSAMHVAVNYVDMSHFIGVLVQTVVAVVSGLVIYCLLSYLAGSEELKWVFARRINNSDVKSIAGEQISTVSGSIED
ncbi:MAG: murein biosynthesis integral membrane protein MurJ [Patescibacteria group bacterium]|jgi:putative peptidoglycan lipid II flippase